MAHEEWKPFTVSSTGNVISELSNLGRYRWHGIVIDYYQFLYNGNLGRDVYRLFIGEIPNGYVIHHINSDHYDNRLDNLMCMTPYDHDNYHKEHPETIFDRFYNKTAMKAIALENREKARALYKKNKADEMAAIQEQRRLERERLQREKEQKEKAAKAYKEMVNEIGYTRMNDGYQERNVLKTECAYYESIGWKYGRLYKNGTKNKGRKFVYMNKDGRNKKVYSEEQRKQLLIDGWSDGFYKSELYIKNLTETQRSLVYVTKDGEVKRVNKEELNEYLSNGWTKGNRDTLGFTYMNKDGHNKKVHSQEEIETLLLNGWTVGFYTTDKLRESASHNGQLSRGKSKYNDMTFIMTTAPLKKYLSFVGKEYHGLQSMVDDIGVTKDSVLLWKKKGYVDMQ